MSSTAQTATASGTWIVTQAQADERLRSHWLNLAHLVEASNGCDDIVNGSFWYDLEDGGSVEIQFDGKLIRYDVEGERVY